MTDMFLELMGAVFIAVLTTMVIIWIAWVTGSLYRLNIDYDKKDNKEDKK